MTLLWLVLGFIAIIIIVRLISHAVKFLLIAALVVGGYFYLTQPATLTPQQRIEFAFQHTIQTGQHVSADAGLRVPTHLSHWKTLELQVWSVVHPASSQSKKTSS